MLTNYENYEISRSLKKEVNKDLLFTYTENVFIFNNALCLKFVVY